MPITLDQAMAHQDWIGNPAEQAWWSWDSKDVYFKQKRTGFQLRGTFEATRNGPRKVLDSDLGKLCSPTAVPDRKRTRTILGLHKPVPMSGRPAQPWEQSETPSAALIHPTLIHEPRRRSLRTDVVGTSNRDLHATTVLEVLV
jgi:hypothetical protein